MKQAAAKDKLTTTQPKGEQPNEVNAVGRFGMGLFDIGWRLAVTVVIFLWGGNWLDERFDTTPWFTVTGFILIIASFVLIVRRVLQTIPRSQGGLKREE